MIPHFSSFKSSTFRKQVLWTEENDLVYKKYLPIVQEIYRKYSGRETLPGQRRFMCLDEFIDLVTACGLIDDTFGAREISVIYYLSMMT